jgi:hypothetical protein
MYLMYVDESGDPGLTNSPTRYFTLNRRPQGIILERKIHFARAARTRANLVVIRTFSPRPCKGAF